MIRTREAPIEPQRITTDTCSAKERRSRVSHGLVQSRLPVPDGATWLTVSEVAMHLRLSSATVYRLIDRGELQHARVSNAIRIAWVHLSAYLALDKE